MKARIYTKAIIASAILAATRSIVRADPVDYHLERVFGNITLNQPSYLMQAPGDPSNVLFYSSRITSANSGFSASNTMGAIYRVVTSGTTSTQTKVLDMSSRTITNDDGLQTFAFSPDFYNATASGYGKIYVASATQGPTSLDRVEQFTLLNSDGSFKNATESFATGVTILQYSNNAQNNHTVDWVGFDPNATGAARNYLYITTGDGSYGNNYNNGTGTAGRPAQNPSNDAGKILRVDVSGGDDYPSDPNKNFAIPASNPIPTYNAAHPGSPLMGLDQNGNPVAANGEVYVTGVRNGYRMSFDRANSNIMFGDVGENQMEEVNILAAGSNASGPPADYGWPQREGLLGSAISGAPQSGTNPFTGAVTINPIQTFTHLPAGDASIGGYVYRGPITSLQGKYFYSDFVTGRLWQLDFDPSTPTSDFDGHNGTNTQIDPLWNALIVDPTNPNYASNVSLGALNGIDHVVSFSEDNAGNVYLIDFGYGTTFDGQYTANAGEIYKLVPGALSFPTTAVWKGNQGTSWSSNATTSNNFTASATGSALTQMIGYTTDVVFAATTSGATSYSTVLNRAFFVNSLTAKSGAPLVTVSNGTTSTTPALVIFNGGVTAEAGSSGITFNATLELGADQNWINNSTASMLINGTVNGPGGITLTGTLTIGTGGLNTTGPFTFNPDAKLLLAGAFTISGATASNFDVVGTIHSDATTIIENSTSSIAYNVLESYSIDTTTFIGRMRDGTTGHVGFRLNGGGTFITSASTGTLSLTGGLTVRYGTMILNGTQHAISGSASITVGDTANLPALLVINNAAISAGGVTAPIQIGAGTSQGVVVLNSGSITSNGELWVSTANLGSGALIVNGGSVTTSSWLAIARGGGSGIFNVTAGTVTINGNPLTVGSSGAGSTTFRAVATFTGGVINANQNVFAGEINSGIITLAGGALLTITSANGGTGQNNGINGLGIANTNNTLGIFNLNGGTLTTTRIMKGAATGNVATFNFNGGTLRPNGTASLSTFMSGLDNAYVNSGGAIIDDTGKTITINQPLKVPTGSGVTAITLSGGSGFFAPPLISISGGGGSGATAVANIDTAGNLTSVTITNPGVNYTSSPTLTIFGGAGEPLSTAYTVTLGSNSGGGLTKLGGGTLILTGGNTYVGPTNILTGKLTIGAGGTTGSLGTGGSVINSGELGFFRTNALTVSNPISGGGTITQSGIGTTTLTGAYSASGPVNVNAGTLAFGPTGGTRQTPATLLNMKNLNIASNAVFDMNNYDLLVGNSNLTTVNNEILAGFGLGNPGDPAITSSTALSSGTTFMVPIDADAILGNGNPGSGVGQVWDGVTISQPGTIVVKYAYFGDDTLDGQVDNFDFATAAGNFGQTTPGLANIEVSWLMGDVTLDGVVDNFDFATMAGNFGQGIGNPLATADISAIPEPANLLVLGMGALAMNVRRRKRG